MLHMTSVEDGENCYEPGLASVRALAAQLVALVGDSTEDNERYWSSGADAPRTVVYGKPGWEQAQVRGGGGVLHSNICTYVTPNLQRETKLVLKQSPDTSLNMDMWIQWIRRLEAVAATRGIGGSTAQDAFPILRVMPTIVLPLGLGSMLAYTWVAIYWLANWVTPSGWSGSAIPSLCVELCPTMRTSHQVGETQLNGKTFDVGGGFAVSAMNQHYANIPKYGGRGRGKYPLFFCVMHSSPPSPPQNPATHPFRWHMAADVDHPMERRDTGGSRDPQAPDVGEHALLRMGCEWPTL